MAAAATAHRLKLFVDPKERRVMFAETSGEAIEFLHSLLVSPHVSLPFDDATRNASIGNVYDSVEKLREFAAIVNNITPPLSTVQQRQKEEERFFVCCGHGNGSCGGYVADKSGARCPSCGGEMAVEVPRGCPGASCSDAYAEPVVMGPDLTCILFDDLTVTPTGSTSIFPMASNFMMSFVAPGRTLQDTVVCLGYTEAIEVLETALQSSTVLTNVFLLKKKEDRRFGKSPK